MKKCPECVRLEEELEARGILMAPGINSVVQLIRMLGQAATDARRREEAMRRKLELHIAAHKAEAK